ncbi:MAG: PAS domain S-box protein [Kiritimatiellae bacterium]|nr:PAS domain S-box protein [Kiritimatiellia bacterium]
MALFVPKDRKSLFRQFLAGMYDAVVITDPNGHILEINPRAEEYFGYSQEEVIDKPVSMFIKGLGPEIVQRIRRGLEEDRHMIIDAAGIERKGDKFAAEVTVSIIDLIDPSDLVFTIRNVERRRKLREMLRTKEAAFSISHAALFACDREGRFMEANEAFMKMFNLADTDVLRTRSFSDLMGDHPLPENFAKALAGETTEVCIVAQTDSGEEDESLQITLAPVTDGRKVRGVAGSIIGG